MINEWVLIGFAAHAKINRERCERVLISCNQENDAFEDGLTDQIRAAAEYQIFYWTERYAAYREIYMESLIDQIDEDLKTLKKMNDDILLSREGDIMASNPEAYVGAPAR